jgi:hypothetical protein
MKHLYLAPTALVASSQIGAHSALACPTDPTRVLLVVEQWISDDAQDTFEAHPDVLELNPWDSGKPAPLTLVGAFQDSKVAKLDPIDTQASALWKIRAAWPTARY